MSNKYKKWEKRIREHDTNHDTSTEPRDYSCAVCHQPSEIIKKEFKRFWKWYKIEIPGVTSFSGKTEENFEELMNEDFGIKNPTGTEKARMKNKLVRLIESMRYERSPQKTLNEIGEMICGMIIASNKFIKRGREARGLYAEYHSSGSEGYNTDDSTIEKDDTLWYKIRLGDIAQ